MTKRCMIQTVLAERWRISEATQEGWRTESNRPVFLKLGNQVRYRLQDIETFEEVALRRSTKIDGEVVQTTTPRVHPNALLPAHNQPGP